MPFTIQLIPACPYPLELPTNRIINLTVEIFKERGIFFLGKVEADNGLGQCQQGQGLMRVNNHIQKIQRVARGLRKLCAYDYVRRHQQIINRDAKNTA